MTTTTTEPISPQCTILRIKRKRGEEVPGVLVIDSSAKKGSKRRRSGLDVFQFAETMSESAWNKLHQDELRTRISKFQKASPGDSLKRKKDEGSKSPVPLGRQSSTQTNASSRQYRVITQPRASEKYKRSSRPSIPPKVLCARDLERASSNLKIYDAVLATPEPEPSDPEMDKFEAMLQEYLTMNDSISQRTQSSASLASIPLSAVPASSSGEYVYDIFYVRPSTIQERVTAANMATVTGISLEEDDGYDYSSESEIEDEADEDSNAEDYYRNDYPEGESDDDDSEVGSELYSDDDFADGVRFEPDD